MDPIEESPELDGVEQGMSEARFESLVKSAIRDAIDYNETTLAPERERALKAYKGEETEGTIRVKGRSTVITREVFESVHLLIPSLARVFLSGERIVDFLPIQADQKPLDPVALQNAEAAALYFQHCFEREIGVHGFDVLAKDALISKTGTIKAYFEESKRFEEIAYTGLDEQQAQFLMAQEGIEILPDTITVRLEPVEMGGAQRVIDCRVRRKFTEREIRFCVVPPEERLVDRDAPSIERSRFWGHKSEKTIGDLVAMGYAFEDVKDLPGGDDTTDAEKDIRNPARDSVDDIDADPMQRRVDYVELWIRVDKDGDGIVETRKVCCGGNAYKILREEIVDCIPIVEICANPEPHVLTGRSLADDMVDIQETKTQLTRSMFDSLSQSVHPKMTIVAGQVNIDDVLSGETSGVIRQTAPGMVDFATTPFVGKEIMPMFGYVDDQATSRVGVSKAAAGLDADILQSTNEKAVTNTITAGLAKVEHIARLWAESFERLGAIFVKLCRRHLDRKKQFHFTGQNYSVDPRAWELDYTIKACSGLGRGDGSQRLQQLAFVISKQEQAIQMAGPNNPVCTVQQYVNALRDYAVLSGATRSPGRYFNDPMVAQQMPVQPPGQQGQQGDQSAAAAAQLSQAEIAKAQIAQRTKLFEILAKDDLERDRMELEIFGKIVVELIKSGAQFRMDQLRNEWQAVMERERASQQMLQQLMAPQPPQGMM